MKDVEIRGKEGADCLKIAGEAAGEADKRGSLSLAAWTF